MRRTAFAIGVVALSIGVPIAAGGAEGALRHVRRMAAAMAARPSVSWAQASGPTGVTPSLSFDAASIREAEPDGTTFGGMRLLPDGAIDVRHLSVAHMVGIAHQIDMYRVVNVPAWAKVISYDIIARANAPSTRDETFAMMRTLLAERFKLQVHRETRPLPGFVVVRGAALGPGLKSSAVDCEADPRRPRCAEGEATQNHIRAFGMPLADLVNLVGDVMGAPIIDRTGLTGTFDLDLRWSTDSAPDGDAPILPTALREQLGLRLQREEIPTEVLVVDHIERPSPN